jgi:hypothetical protein
MKNFAVTIEDFETGKVSKTKINAPDILSAVKEIRKKSKLCYNDKDLIEWHNTSDEWDAPIDDEFLTELIDEEEPGVYYAMLAEEVEFQFKEI